MAPIDGLPGSRTPAMASEQVTRLTLPPVVSIIGVIALLYIARDVLLPIAIALLLTFALAPIVSFLRRRGVPRVLATVATVATAFAAIALLAFVVASQVSALATNIPTYQYNIIEKVRSLKEIGGGDGVIERVTRAIERVGAEIRQDAPAPGNVTAQEAPKPLPVEIVANESPLEMIQNILVPLISPFATLGLIIVVVIFMLLEREVLRDRFIRLVGSSDLHRTTEALQDAGRRVGRYLLMQLVINATYAVPITIGLWLLGIPNALLWGLLTMVLRFVPYIGPAIGMILPLMVTLAVTPGWAPLLWTAALFIVVELISNNVMEPWLYGSGTGLSPLSIIVAAIFWAWLWGPLGLVLSTPLTVCLVVLGRHVQQFQFLDVLLGNEPVLEPHARAYQRLLAGDPDEVADHAEEFLEDGYLVEFYDTVGIPALVLAEQDRQRGVMGDETRERLADSTVALIADLEEFADEEEEDNEQGEDEADKEKRTAANGMPVADLPEGEGKTLLCIGGRGSLDDAAAAMMAQVLEVQGAEVQHAKSEMMSTSNIRTLPLGEVDTIILAFLNQHSATHARYAVRRLKRINPNARVGFFMPAGVQTEEGTEVTAESMSADFITTTLADTIVRGFAEEKPTRLKAVRKRLSTRRKPAKKVRAAA